MDEQLEQQMIADEIERLRLWDERVAREKEANDKEAAELAILIAEERKRPKDSDRLDALESEIVSLKKITLATDTKLASIEKTVVPVKEVHDGVRFAN